MKKPNKPARPDGIEAAEERFRAWCRQKIEADPRYEHAIVTEMVHLYAAAGGLQARDDATALLADLGSRVVQDARRNAARAAGAKGGRQPKENAAARWQTPALDLEVKSYLGVENDVNIAKRITTKVYRDVETLRKYVARIRKAEALKK